MAIEKQVEAKTYTRTTAQVKAALGIGAGETINRVTLDVGGIEVETLEGTNPRQVRTYRITAPDARTILGMANSEEFDHVEYDGANAYIYTIRRVI